jgi:UDP-N-acetyl-D-glucosamine dehydrogenase
MESVTTGASSTSVAPDGSVHVLQSEADAQRQFREIVQAAELHRSGGGRVVVVQGLGFVGAAVAAVIASAADDRGNPLHFVIGVDLPTPDGYWKVAKINAGATPIASADDELARLTLKAVHESRNLRATTCEEAYAIADVILVDVQLDAHRTVNSQVGIRVDLESFVSAIRTIGRNMRPDALVLIETTVPVGMTDDVVLPTLRDERLARGIDAPVLLAHAYERVMPGPQYVSSIRAHPRAFAGADERSAEATREFLSTFITAAGGAGLTQLENPVSSELAKLLENSYRATNIAFIHEWTLLAEKLGVNLFQIIDAIRVRKGTHDNMRYPGFGVGGYCLTKDSLLAQWGASQLLGSENHLPMTLDALQTNALMPLHTARLVEEAAAGDLEGAIVAVCGVSYIPDVADTRSSPAEVLVDELIAAGAALRVHDPNVREWVERPDIPIIMELEEALYGVDGVVLTVPHLAFRRLSASQLAQHVRRSGGFLVDAFNIVTDETAVELHAAGWRVLGVGKGHWRKRGLHRQD